MNFKRLTNVLNVITIILILATAILQYNKYGFNGFTISNIILIALFLFIVALNNKTE